MTIARKDNVTVRNYGPPSTWPEELDRYLFGLEEIVKTRLFPRVAVLNGNNETHKHLKFTRPNPGTLSVSTVQFSSNGPLGFSTFSLVLDHNGLVSPLRFGPGDIYVLREGSGQGGGRAFLGSHIATDHKPAGGTPAVRINISSANPGERDATLWFEHAGQTIVTVYGVVGSTDEFGLDDN